MRRMKCVHTCRILSALILRLVESYQSLMSLGIHTTALIDDVTTRDITNMTVWILTSISHSSGLDQATCIYSASNNLMRNEDGRVTSPCQ